MVVEKAGAPHESVAFASTVIGVINPQPFTKLCKSKIESTDSVVIMSKTSVQDEVVDLNTLVDLASLILVAGKDAFSVDAVMIVCSWSTKLKFQNFTLKLHFLYTARTNPPLS